MMLHDPTRVDFGWRIVSAVFVELAFVVVWTACVFLYVAVRGRRCRTERVVLADVLDGTRLELERVHERCTRDELELERMHARCTRILCAVHKFQHANPMLGDAIDNALGEDEAGN